MLFDTVVAYLNSRSRILIQTPWTGAVGNCAEEIYFGLLKARREGKRVCFLFPRDTEGARGWFRFSNKKLNTELLQIHSPYRFLGEGHPVIFSLEWLLSLVYYVFRFLSAVLTACSRRIGRRRRFRDDYLIPVLGQSHLWRPAGTKRFECAVVQQFQWRKQLETYLPVSLPPAHEKQAEDIRSQMGLPLTAWFVCLHVREGGFYNDHIEASCRNASIHNYLKAIKAITDQGGWVVRLGDPTMTKLPEMEHVVDYAHSKYKSDLMDVYLIKECSLYIGMQSGIFDVAALFQKPMLMPNMYEWLFNFPLRRGDLGILKHVFSKSRNRFLSIQELLALSDRRIFVSQNSEDDDDLVFHENSEDEIAELVKEYYQTNPDRGLSALQIRFQNRRLEETYKILEGGPIWPDFVDVHNKFRVASRLEGCKGAISDGFLAANWDVNERSGNTGGSG